MVNYKKYGWRGYMWPLGAIAGFAALVMTLYFTERIVVVAGLWIATAIAFWLTPKDLQADIAEDERRSYTYRP